MKRLTGWVFMYNEYTGNWQAALRDDYNLLYNDVSSPKVLKSKSINTLMELIAKTGGDTIKLNKLTRGKTK